MKRHHSGACFGKPEQAPQIFAQGLYQNECDFQDGIFAASPNPCGDWTFFFKKKPYFLMCGNNLKTLLLRLFEKQAKRKTKIFFFSQNDYLCGRFRKTL